MLCFVIDGELPVQEELQLFEELRQRPVRERGGEIVRVPRMRQRVADQEEFLFRLLDFREVAGIADGTADLLDDVQQVWLERKVVWSCP